MRQINFVSYYCTSLSQVPFILIIQFTTNKVNGASYFSARENYLNTTAPNVEYITYGTVNELSIYADPGTTISIALQCFETTSGTNTVCNITLGGLVVDK